MERQEIQSLWASTQASLAGFEKDQSEACRKEALAQVTKLQRALEQPKDAILKLSYQVSINIADGCHHRSRILTDTQANGLHGLEGGP